MFNALCLNEKCWKVIIQSQVLLLLIGSFLLFVVRLPFRIVHLVTLSLELLGYLLYMLVNHILVEKTTLNKQ